MKIEISLTQPPQTVADINPGETFRLVGDTYGNLYMRTGIRTQDRITCFNLADSAQSMFRYDREVTAVKAKIVNDSTP